MIERKLVDLGGVGFVLLLLIGGTLWGLSASGEGHSENLIENPGFEEPNPANWKTKDKVWIAPWSYSWSTTSTHHGERSTDVDINVGWYEGWWESTPAVPVSAGQPYSFSGWIKSEDVERQAFLKLIFLDSYGVEVMTRNSGGVSGSSDSWVRVSPADSVIAPREAISALVRCQLSGKGKAWFDDIILRPASGVFVDKTGPETVQAGGEITYHIVYGNVGNGEAQEIMITDTLPLSVELKRIDAPDLTCTQPICGLVVCNVGAMGENSSGDITVVVTASHALADGKVLTNNVLIAGKSAVLDYAWVTTTVTSWPILELDKDCNVDWALVSDEVRYNLSFRNTGVASATHVWLTDTLPLGVNYVTSSLSPDFILTSPNRLVWSDKIGALEAKGKRHYIMVAVTVTAVTESQLLTNIAEIKCSHSEDRAKAYFWAVTDVPVYFPIVLRRYPPEPDLSTSYKTVRLHIDGSRVFLTYTIDLTNTGSLTATGVSLVDKIPIGASYVTDSATPEVECSYSVNSNQIVCEDLEIGIEENIVVSFLVELNVEVSCYLDNVAWLNDGFHQTSFDLANLAILTQPLPLFLNAGFETGNLTCWQTGGNLEETVVPELSNGDPPLSGNFSALLGEPSDEPEFAPEGTASIIQTVSVPSTVSPVLSFSYRIFSYDKNEELLDDFDSFDVEINGVMEFRDAKRDGPYGKGCKDPASELETKNISLANLKGKDVTFCFKVRNTDGWFNTWVYLDDVRVVP